MDVETIGSIMTIPGIGLDGYLGADMGQILKAYIQSHGSECKTQWYLHNLGSFSILTPENLSSYQSITSSHNYKTGGKVTSPQKWIVTQETQFAFAPAPSSTTWVIQSPFSVTNLGYFWECVSSCCWGSVYSFFTDWESRENRGAFWHCSSLFSSSSMKISFSQVSISG